MTMLGNAHVLFCVPGTYAAWNPFLQTYSNTPVRGIRIGNHGGYAHGYNSTAIGDRMSVGNLAGTSGHNTVIIGRNFKTDINDCLMVGFNTAQTGAYTSVPTLYVGPSSVYNTAGQVGVGTSAVAAGYILTVSGDATFSNNVGIGTDCVPSDCKLAVEGTLRARRLIAETTNWCDYVFDSEYELMSLDSLEKYIQINNHLPEMPSEKEVVEKGIDFSEMAKDLLKRAEENTLYIITLEKENIELKRNQELLLKRLEEIEKQLKK